MAWVYQENTDEIKKALLALFARMLIETNIATEKKALRTLKITKRQYLKYISDIEDEGIYEVTS